MNDKEFRAQIKRGLAGGYLIYGDEEYLKDYLVAEAVKSVVGDDDMSAVNLLETDENSFDCSVLDDALSLVPMMAEKCCAVVRVRFSELKQDEKDQVYCSLDSLKDNPALVLLLVVPRSYFDEGNPGKNSPSADLKELSRYLEPVPVPYQNASVLKKWLARHFAAEQLAVSDEALSAMVDKVGQDMCALSGETEKLICYTKAKGSDSVDLAAVALVCSGSEELDAFALSNAVVSGDREGAIAAVRECRDKRQKPVNVIARMTSEFVNMMSVSVLMKRGMMKQEISKTLGIHEYRVGRYMNALKDVEPSAVRAVIERCAEVDAALKSSGGGYDLIERFVCTIPSKKRIATRY